MTIRLVLVVGLAFAIAGVSVKPAPAESASYRARVEGQYRTWREQELWPKAEAAGVSRAVFDAALKGARLNWKLPDLRPPGRGAKAPNVRPAAEFRGPARYFKESSLKSLARIGRSRMAKWSDTLDRIEQTYGVPRGILIAIWGRETGYGGAKLPHSAVQSLVTQSFMGRRKAFFEKELLSALVILQQGHISPARMRSSWAGALGQPQFLPSMFLKFAVDFDGDGKRNIWTSVPDTLASIANFLAKNGWDKERDWGYEVKVPASVTCALGGPEQGRPIREWVDMGIGRVKDRRFPKQELDRTGFMLMPAGRSGPAYVVTPNFYVLKTYNESDLYALFVGHMADRLAGSPRFVASWGKIGGFTLRDVQLMQERLEKLGYDVGGADGLIGFKTRIAVGLWQERNGRKPTCFPDRALMRRIR